MTRTAILALVVVTGRRHYLRTDLIGQDAVSDATGLSKVLATSRIEAEADGILRIRSERRDAMQILPDV